ncbi:hypothetical protein BV898_15028 [Hypsibius exemplaris]|uniref:Uncharacterized protein n=1 Tax=Hypsibius exemplaris TaxID=2072580 RepID=A0A9X6NAN0_HYPEX|nr:hypothetical protein BV898_15028 [Hypsibius exemplaris]
MKVADKKSVCAGVRADHKQSGCPQFRHARCVAVAGHRRWFMGQQEVSGKCFTSQNCQCANIMSPCVATPTCPKIPSAKCVSNCCGAYFYEGSQEVTSRC